ncbi:acyltransferase [Limosilactobacillus mucosae]|uniref:acyltransferase n=1 Tax=Limosilactobacillus mucosae TaxID=97478 RepID=UPI00233F33D9|nr:DapH/DapD/GlmU-related protein [Limosilactobacillus mucosae]MDC2842575.1 DapH/DapD/GlmU-related protein [Limosilactobacillus mucosae]
MPHISKQTTNQDRLIICTKAFIKIFRGFYKGITLKKVKFPLFIGRNTSISHKRNIFCGKNVKFEDYSEIQGLSRNGLYFGDNVTIGRYTSIRPSSYYGVGKIGDGLQIGNNSSIGPFGYIGCSGKVIIGKNVMIGPKVSIFAENHNFSDINTSIKKQGVNSKGVTIEDNCWIGSGVIILDGATIGHGSVIGAGVIITKDILPNSIVIDKRDKIIRSRLDD